MANFFGFEIRRKKEEEQQQLPSFAPEVADDGAVVVAAGGHYGQYVDLEGTVRTEAELITRYRDMLRQPEVDNAVDEIVNESITVDIEQEVVELNLDEIEVSDSIKKLIQSEFDEVLDLLNFNNTAHDIFRRWYVDGRITFHAIIDPKDTAKGIQELRYIDPRKLRKIKEVKRKKDPMTDANIVAQEREFYVYNEKGFQAKAGSQTSQAQQTSGVRIAKDSIVQCTSGITDTNNTMVLSHLHKAIKPLNQLRMMEDASVIYRLARAPERRIFYIDVGNLPKVKAEQYLKDMMTRHKNKLVYDAATGEIRDDRKMMTMLEDFWLPRREGGKGTQIETLPGGQNLGQMDDILYFQKRLFNSLNVPITRLEGSTAYSIGRATEITRDEIKFARFIDRLQKRFSLLFIDILEKQLLLKRIVTSEEWAILRQKLLFKYGKDNYFAELKDVEVITGRMNVLNLVAPYAGKYFSHKWIRQYILRQDEEEQKEIDKEIAEEGTDPQFMAAEPTDGVPDASGSMGMDAGNPQQ